MYRIKSIGEVSVADRFTFIKVNQKYKKALKYVEEFSHIHVFYLENTGDGSVLKKEIVEIVDTNQKKGTVKASILKGLADKAELIDIKPYFPSEDTVGEAACSIRAAETKESMNDRSSEIAQAEPLEEATKEGYAYELDAIGEIRNVNGRFYIQLQERVEITSEYLTVFWWFHKFDSNQYRGVTECDPPYENAPRSGIFATRSPVRPNPIAMTVIRVLEVDKEKKRIYVNQMESFDRTPCIGVCEYEARQCVRNCVVPPWLRHWPRAIDEKVTDYKASPVKIKDGILSSLLAAREETAGHFMVPEGEPNRRVYDKPTEIHVRGARENNLQGIDINIPYGKLTAVVGVSGSGKSSLVDQTIYAECRRRMEYLSYSTNVYQKPRVDEMTGCIPAVVIRQDAIRGNVFSTVGTYTDAYDYIRNIFSNAAVRHCPTCGNEIIPLSEEAICEILRKQQESTILNLSDEIIRKDSLEEAVRKALADGEGAFYALINQEKILFQTKQKCYHCNKILFELTPATFSFMDPDCRCPVCHGRGRISVADEQKLIDHPEKSLLDGASSFYGKLRSFRANPNANWMKGQVFGLADSMQVDLEKPWNCLPEGYQDALLHGCEREVTFSYDNKKNGRKGEITRKVEGLCSIVERLLEENDTAGMLNKYLKSEKCSACGGERLAAEGRMATLLGCRYPEAAGMTFLEIIGFCEKLQLGLKKEEFEKIASGVSALLEIAETAVSLGVGYLPLSQETGTLSAGEGQRLKLLGAFKNHISGILFIFDEPSKGLHPKDYQKIINLMKSLICEGNTIIMVEHNEDMIRVADYVIEIGPGAGEKGGTLVGEGTLTAMLNHKETQISKYMNQSAEVFTKDCKKTLQNPYFAAENLVSNNLKNISIRIPLQALTCICGVSGSGKSTLMRTEISKLANKDKKFSKVVMIDQAAIGKTSKSIVATYIGVMDLIRGKFANTTEAVKNGLDESHFSFNSPNGQCDTCKGEGKIKIKFSEDITTICPDCHGTRYKKNILTVLYQGKNVSEILDMSVNQAALFFAEDEQALSCLNSLKKVGLGYLKLGQGTASLSGGEASRLKLAKELLVKASKNVLYLLDEPTTGLHFSDVTNLLLLIDELIKSKNTVVAIEHNKQFLKHADWLVELGPGAGKEGGNIVYQGGNNIE